MVLIFDTSIYNRVTFFLLIIRRDIFSSHRRWDEAFTLVAISIFFGVFTEDVVSLGVIQGRREAQRTPLRLRLQIRGVESVETDGTWSSRRWISPTERKRRTRDVPRNASSQRGVTRFHSWSGMKLAWPSREFSGEKKWHGEYNMVTLSENVETRQGGPAFQHRNRASPSLLDLVFTENYAKPVILVRLLTPCNLPLSAPRESVLVLDSTGSLCCCY